MTSPTATDSPMSAVQVAYLYNHRPSATGRLKAIPPMREGLTSLCRFAAKETHPPGRNTILKALLAHFSRQHSFDSAAITPH